MTTFRGKRLFAGTCPILAILVLGALSDSCGRRPETSSPNVVILFADDLGYGDLSCYGHPTIQTPNLDRMADEGMRLTSFYAAAPSCTPSRAALLTGRYPLRVGLPHVLGPDSTQGIAPSEVTLAELLSQKGYRTLAVGKWHLGHAQPEFLPTANGFDAYMGLLYSNDMIRPWVQTEKPLELWRNNGPIEHPVNQSTLTTRYTEEALNFIRTSSREGKAFFLYLAYSMVHVPIHTTDEFQGKSRAGLYGDVVQTIDWSVGRILETLREQKVDGNTLVVFTSDNGPWMNMPDRMFSGGTIQPWHAGSPGPLRGYKGNTYEGGMRVPAIFRWPGRIPAGQVSTELASTLDVLPTLTDWTGAPLPEDVRLDGESITSLLAGNSLLGERHFFYFRGEDLEAVRRGKWKLRVSSDLREDVSEGESPSPELFDLDIDPSERYNRAGEFPSLVRELAASMAEVGTELGARVSANVSTLGAHGNQ